MRMQSDPQVRLRALRKHFVAGRVVAVGEEYEAPPRLAAELIGAAKARRAPERGAPPKPPVAIPKVKEKDHVPS